MRNIRLFRVLAVFAVLLLSVGVTAACEGGEFDVDGDAVEIAAVEINSSVQNEEYSSVLDVLENPPLRESRNHLDIHGETIEDFSFIARYPDLTWLRIVNTHIKSFDYFVENLSNLHHLEMIFNTFDEEEAVIPHLEGLSSLLVGPLEDAFRLVELNTHVRSFSIISGYSPLFDDEGRVEGGLVTRRSHLAERDTESHTETENGFELHVTLESIIYFENMESFGIRHGATSVDVTPLGSINTLEDITFSIWVYRLIGAEYLADLPNLKNLNVSDEVFRLIADENSKFIHNENVLIGEGPFN